MPCLLLLPACPGKEGLLTGFDPSTTGDFPDTSTGGASSTSNGVSTGEGVSTADSSTAVETAGLETEGAATDTTFDPEDPPPQTVTSFTGGEEHESEGSGGWPPDLCADLGCGADQICVSPSSWCDYGQDPPEFVYPPPFCADFPVQCESAPLLDFCLADEFCTENFADYADEHIVFCAGAPDCF
ncbi:hypothetical protein OV203_13000 [Nannocystis sp. ILAH1]|uniref:hypothetical protein n=1 Tax=unclassified Nannocystis TaxID=2627009 RepID=UPI002270785D|nr:MULTISPECIES: hypothetical protein [unclassified Nannocystis]MCY0988048.1 hypothetical protein [Nannocystis sp. ILAH1]MCY1065570.1 hypothetical protein [Nannocystis sp. RBIL2]